MVLGFVYMIIGEKNRLIAHAVIDDRGFDRRSVYDLAVVVVVVRSFKRFDWGQHVVLALLLTAVGMVE